MPDYSISLTNHEQVRGQSMMLSAWKEEVEFPMLVNHLAGMRMEHRTAIFASLGQAGHSGLLDWWPSSSSAINNEKSNTSDPVPAATMLHHTLAHLSPYIPLILTPLFICLSPILLSIRPTPPPISLRNLSQQFPICP